MCILWRLHTVHLVPEYSFFWQSWFCPVNEELDILLSEQFMYDHKEGTIMNKLNFEWSKFCEWIPVMDVNALVPGWLLRKAIVRKATIWQLQLINETMFLYLCPPHDWSMIFFSALTASSLTNAFLIWILLASCTSPVFTKFGWLLGKGSFKTRTSA